MSKLISSHGSLLYIYNNASFYFYVKVNVFILFIPIVGVLNNILYIFIYLRKKTYLMLFLYIRIFRLHLPHQNLFLHHNIYNNTYLFLVMSMLARLLLLLHIIMHILYYDTLNHYIINNNLSNYYYYLYDILLMALMNRI